MSSAGFSGAIKLAEMNDYLAANQSCIKPLMKPNANVASGGEAQPKANAGTKVRVELEFGSNDAMDLRFPGLQAPGGSLSIAPPVASGHFDQMKLDPIKKTASVSLNDCLACSGCVTSAETVLITQQSTQEFLNVLAGKDGTDTPPVSENAMTDVASETPASNRKQVIVSISPQSLTALAHEFKLSPLVCAKKLTTFFLSLGCMAFVDTTPALDIALLEAQEEFVQRYLANQARLDGSAAASAASVASTVVSNSAASSSSSTHTNTVSPSSASPLPILASECPGWICYCEKTQGVETLAHVSSVRSAQAIMGALLKHWWCTSHASLSPNQIFHTTIMPCYDKKLEGSRDDFFIEQFATRETDCVLTTGEVVELLKEKGIDMSTIAESPLNKDFFNVNAEQTELYRSIDVGGSGGYAENLFRYAAQRLFNQSFPPSTPLTYVAGRNTDFRELNLTVDGKTVLSFALAYGFRNIQNLVRKMKTKKAGKVSVAAGSVTLSDGSATSSNADAMTDVVPSASSVSASSTSVTLPVGTGGYHFVEVMACPSGCLNGGGQIKAGDIRAQKQLVQDLDVLYHERPVCEPQENPIVQRIYKEWLQGAAPYTGLARQHLHTQYHAVEKELANPLGIKW